MKKLIFTVAVLSGTFALAQQKKTDSTKTTDIQEVSLTKKVFEKKSDRLVFDVAASPIAKGNTAFNLLKETPLVSSTDDKNLKIAGKSNAVIYIDGRKTQMNPDALEAFLKNTPAENIQKIEVITLPGSEFNVESTDGVINIILKKKMSDGANGNLRFADRQSKYNTPSSSANLNFRKGKFAGTGNFSYSQWSNDQEYDLANGTAQNHNTSVGNSHTFSENMGGYVNLDYQLAERHNLGLSYNVWWTRMPEETSEFFNTITSGNVLYYTKSTTDATKDQSLNNNLNLNYDWKIDDKGSKLSLSSSYLKYRRDQTVNNTADLVDAQSNFIKTQNIFRQYTPQNIDNLSFLANFTKIFKSFTLGAGGNFSTTKSDNDAYQEDFDFATNLYVRNLAQSQHFKYHENIGGVYLNLEKNFSEKFSAKIGSRLEFTDSHGEILNTDITVDRHNIKLLPTLNMNYNPDKNSAFSYAFTSRVRRPSFWELNPVREYLTTTNYVQNNPFMKQSSIYNQELMYMHKNAYFLQIQNSYTQDAITQVPLQKQTDGVTILRYIRTNYGSENNFNVNLGMNKSFFNQIWTTNYVLGLQLNSYKGAVDTDPITGEKFDPYVFEDRLATPFFQASNTIRLSSKKDWFLGVNYFYLGKSRQDLGILQPLQQLDFSLKKIWNNWTFNLDVRDVLKTNKIKLSETQSSGYYNKINQYNYQQNITLSIVYNFGNQKLQKIRTMDNASQDIKSRTGN